MAQSSQRRVNRQGSSNQYFGNQKKHLDEKIQALKGCLCFTHLSEDLLKDAAASATLRRFKRGEFILQEGDLPIVFQVIQKGHVKIFKQTASGKNFIMSVLSPGQALNGVVVLEGRPHFVSAQALDDVSIIRVRREDYLTLLERHPSVALKIIGILDKVLASTYDRVIDIVGERAEQRVCNILFMLHKGFGNELSFTTGEIADMAGTTAETAIRVLTRFKELHVIDRTGRRKLRILDEAELKNLSRGPFYL